MKHKINNTNVTIGFKKDTIGVGTDVCKGPSINQPLATSTKEEVELMNKR